MFNIVLLEPRIPQNTGNIGRLCVAGWARLHLIHPLGFTLSQKELKRAGMDYWEKLEVFEWDTLADFHKTHPISSSHFFLSTKASKTYYDANFNSECFIYFGREDAGLPQKLLEENSEQTL